jgi:excisionase family DNA binding protein
MENQEKLENFIAEQTLCELLGVKKAHLAALRAQKNLPFIRIGRTKRLYREQSIVQWLIKNEITISPDTSET